MTVYMGWVLPPAFSSKVTTSQLLLRFAHCAAPKPRTRTADDGQKFSAEHITDAGQAGDELGELAVETEHSLSESDDVGGRRPPGRECKRLPADGFHGGLGKPVRPRGSSYPIFLRCRAALSSFATPAIGAPNSPRIVAS